MVSHLATILQMSVVKREGNHLNGTITASSGNMWRQPPRLSREGAAQRRWKIITEWPHCSCGRSTSIADTAHNFFALDSLSNFLHSDLTSQPAQRLVPR